MTQDSANIPQADELQDVVNAVVAVSEGKTSFQAIGKAIGKVGRQGRYYRLAAEILGFIQNGQNEASLRPAGYELLRLRKERPQETVEYLRHRVLSIPVAKATFEYIQRNPASTNADLSEMLLAVFELNTESTRYRRVQTLVHWLRDLNLIQGKSGSFQVVRQQDAVGATWDDSEPDMPEDGTDGEDIEPELGSLPTAPALRELERIWSGERKGASTSPVDAIVAAQRLAEEAEEEKAQEDAASVRHQALVEHMAGQLRHRSGSPQYNARIDLYGEIGSASFLFEMKSCGHDNLIAQARRGLAQLYEYRYLYQLDGVKLVLVLESEPTGPNRWYLDYLVRDRGILVCWALAGGGFGCLPECMEDLSPLIANE